MADANVSLNHEGFERGLKGKGANVAYLQSLFDLVREKKCQLTEVRWIAVSF